MLGCGVALANRVLVAGGGAGGGTNCFTALNNNGGNGGGTTGQDGYQCLAQTSYVGQGGTQAAGGASLGGLGIAGVLGVGGTGGATYGGGGGGGYYGGGGGSYGGGGGGSNYAGPSVTGAINTQGTGTGNGQLILTWSAPAMTCPSPTRTPVTVTLSQPAASAATATPATINCPGTAVNLTATNASGAISWYTVATGGTSVGTSASGANFGVTPATTTTYYAEATFSGGGGGPGTQTFNYTGAAQTFTVPAGVTSVTIDAYGAEGLGFNGFTPGQGGRAKGDLTVTPGQVLNIYVGG